MYEKEKNNSETIQKEDDIPKSFIERLERLSEEKNNINFDFYEDFSEAKSMVYDQTVIRKILTLRKMYIDERSEQEILLKSYKNASGMSG